MFSLEIVVTIEEDNKPSFQLEARALSSIEDDKNLGHTEANIFKQVIICFKIMIFRNIFVVGCSGMV